MGRLSIEDETQCTQLCNVAIPVFIASATNIIDPGNPKKISRLTRLTMNNLGQIKFTPFTSVISLVLNRLPTASTSKNELVERSAWLISIQKLANISED